MLLMALVLFILCSFALQAITAKIANLKEYIILKKANTIIEAALIESNNLALQPISIAILDAGGHLIASQREDKAGILRFDIAFAKA